MSPDMDHVGRSRNLAVADPFPKESSEKMRDIFCRQGTVPIDVDQKWALVVNQNGFVGMLVLQVKGFFNELVEFEVLHAESEGRECDLVDLLWQTSLDRFGHGEQYYFANSRWDLWNDMIPYPEMTDEARATLGKKIEAETQQILQQFAPAMDLISKYTA